MPIMLETYHAPRTSFRRHFLLIATFLLGMMALSGYLHRYNSLRGFDYSLFSPSRTDHSCPNPILPRRNLTFSAATGASCIYPDVVNDDFVISICHDPSICNAFSLTVRRRDVSFCLNGPGRPLSADPELEASIIRESGPDDIRVAVNGAELYATTKAVIDDCSYRFDVALQNAGPAEVQVTLFHSVSTMLGFACFQTREANRNVRIIVLCGIR